MKCRDLHWAMMAHRDQRDVSLSSLRMLIVTDGANPCECGVAIPEHLTAPDICTEGHLGAALVHFKGLTRCCGVCICASVTMIQVLKHLLA